MTDHTNIDQLYRTYAERLERNLARKLSNAPRELVADACATAWRILVEKEADVRNHPNIEGWLYTVALHEAFALMRKSQVSSEPEAAENVAAADDPATTVEQRDRLDRAARAFKTLKPQEQQVLSLRYQGLSYEQIAEKLGKTYTWVNRYVTEGNRRLREAMREDGGED